MRPKNKLKNSTTRYDTRLHYGRMGPAESNSDGKEREEEGPEHETAHTSAHTTTKKLSQHTMKNSINYKQTQRTY